METSYLRPLPWIVIYSNTYVLFISTAFMVAFVPLVILLILIFFLHGLVVFFCFVLSYFFLLRVFLEWNNFLATFSDNEYGLSSSVLSQILVIIFLSGNTLCMMTMLVCI